MILNKLMKEMNHENLKTTPLPVTNYRHNAEVFHTIQPYYFDKSKNFWVWVDEEKCWKIIDDTTLLNYLDKNLTLSGETITIGIKNNYIEAFRRVGRDKEPKKAEKSWIQFKDWIYDIKTKEGWEATPAYFLTNPIPWKMGKTTTTPTMDKLFEEWVGERYVKTLYEIIAYCCYTDYPIHLAFCLIGSGRNGKSQFQRLLSKFIGENNCISTELDNLVKSRFEPFRLYKKLVCLMSETNFGTMSQTSMLKKLTGNDLIGFEQKNKTGFDGYNYATLMINSNSMPTSTDTSEGFFRRWLIIDFPNSFSEGKDILETIPDEEYNNLARKVCMILPELLKKGTLTNQGTIEERRTAYIKASNPLPFFLEECCVEDVESWIKTAELFNAYKQYLKKEKKRIVKNKEFTSGLEEEGWYQIRVDRYFGENRFTGMAIEGLALKDDWKSAFTASTAIVSNSSLHVGNEVEKSAEQAEDAGQPNMMEEFVK